MASRVFKMAYDISELLANKVHVLINPKSGGKPGVVARKVKERLGDENFIYYESQKKGDITGFATSIANEAYQKQSPHLVLVIGGDGTIEEAVNAKANLENVVLGLTSGTVGELAKFLGTRSPARLCNLVNGFVDGELDINEYVIRMDLLRVRYDITRNKEGIMTDYKEVKAANVFSTGFESDVCNKVNSSFKRGGLLKILDFAKAGKDVLQYYEPASFSYTINEDQKLNFSSDNMLSFAVMNGRYAAGSLSLDPYARLDDGLATALIIKAMPLPQLAAGIIGLKLIPNAGATSVSGASQESSAFYQNQRKNGIQYLPAINSITLKNNQADSSREYYFEVDGEHYRIENPESEIIIGVLPGATNILMIKD